MNDYKTLKELTPSQKEKAEKITSLILELQKKWRISTNNRRRWR